MNTPGNDLMRSVFLILALFALAATLVFECGSPEPRVFDAQMAKTHQSQLRRPDSAGTQEMSDTDGTAREGPWDVTDNLAKSLAPQPRESWSGASPSDADASLVAEICAAIMNGSTLSSTGSNVTVAVADGMVIVQGHVKNQGEKDAIGSVAKRVLGVEHVDNQLVAQGG